MAARTRHPNERRYSYSLAVVTGLGVVFLNVAYKSKGSSEAIQLGIAVGLFCLAALLGVAGVVSERKFQRRKSDGTEGGTQ